MTVNKSKRKTRSKNVREASRRYRAAWTHTPPDYALPGAIDGKWGARVKNEPDASTLTLPPRLEPGATTDEITVAMNKLTAAVYLLIQNRNKLPRKS